MISLFELFQDTSLTNLKPSTVSDCVLSFFETLLKQTVTFCDDKGFSLSELEAFDLDNKVWQRNLLKVYKDLYSIDFEYCYK